MERLPVFVINLDRQTDRWTSITTELAKVGIVAIRVQAIDAQNMKNSPPAFLSAGDYACTLSHRKALHHFLDTDHPAALILEDDTELATDLPSTLENVEWWPSGVKLISLDNLHPKLLHLGNECGQTPSGRSLRPLTRMCYGAAGYLINREAALMVLDASRTATIAMDAILFDLRYSRTARRLKPTQVVPSMVRQKSEHLDSGIEPYREALYTGHIRLLWKLQRLCIKLPGLPYGIKVLFLRCLGFIRGEMVSYRESPGDKLPR